LTEQGVTPREKLSSIIHGHGPARAAHVAAELGLADLIAGGRDTLEFLAQDTGIDVWRLGRLMRYLGAMGLLRKSGEHYSLTDVGDFLRKDKVESLYNAARFTSFGYRAFTDLREVLRDGQPGYLKSTGRRFFEALADEPDVAAAYDVGMHEIHGAETIEMPKAYDFGAFDVVMDVGGGSGEVLMAILRANPGIRGRLFDLPHVVARTKTLVKAAGLEGRCDLIGGDFFKEIPPGADAIILRHVIHDWPEQDALRLLKNCREAISPSGRVIVGEALIEETDTFTPVVRLDMAMLAYHGGAERTESEYRQLLEQADLKVTRVVPVTSGLALIESQPI
jgi:ubiquinone/menaquinone biosynthesis C-methylase UbiE